MVQPVNIMTRLPVEEPQPFAHTTEHGGTGGGGSDLDNRITRIETIIENQQQLMVDLRSDMRGIRSDIQGLERRLIDKADENHKWVIGLIISSILIPLLIALVTK